MWRDVTPNMSARAIDEFLTLVDRVWSVELADGVKDKIVWIWEGDGLFSARSAYRAHFVGWTEEIKGTGNMQGLFVAFGKEAMFDIRPTTATAATTSDGMPVL